jgi:hypothetical protein
MNLSHKIDNSRFLFALETNSETLNYTGPHGRRGQVTPTLTIQYIKSSRMNWQFICTQYGIITRLVAFQFVTFCMALKGFQNPQRT